MRVLAIGAHPDDVELGCGGTLVKHIQKGDEVAVITLTDNFRSPDIFYDWKESLNILGIKEREWLGFADSKLEKILLWHLARDIEDVIYKTSIPDIVYTHDDKDLSQDHRITSQAVLIAFRPVWGKPISIYTFESPSGSEWGTERFTPNCFVDISETMFTKLEALKCYKTEMRPFPHPRSEEAVIARAKVWGTYCGLVSAEAFRVVRGFML